jgi:hypothetical protein
MKNLTKEQREKLIQILKFRFEKNMNRHRNIKWDGVLKKLLDKPEKLWSLNEMEKTLGEPDVVGYDKKTREFIFCDCSPETPNRRNLCYDAESLKSRKENKPKNSAFGIADEMGIEILDEEQYRELQKLGEFDTKTSSWIKTPKEIRKLGGALFADFRYGKVFIYHNGAESYYASRGFRGILRI